MPEEKTNNARSLVLPLLLCGMLLTGAGLAYWHLSPKMFQAATRLRVVDWVKSADLKKTTDEKVVFAECAVIRSNAVMDQAIQSLHLTELWGKKFHQGTPLTLDETRARLRAFASVRPLPHSTVIEISAAGTNADDLAPVVNAIATAYRDYSRARRDEQIKGKLAGLTGKWDAQNEKIRAAQTKVDELYFEVTRQRSTNVTQFYDNDAYDLLLAKRVQLKTRLVDEQSQMAGFKKLDREQLKNVLSSMDTNSALLPTMLRLNQANNELFKARSDHGDDSPEVRNATIAVTKLKEQLNAEVDAIMRVRETQLSALQTTLEELENKLKHASTNAPKPTIEDTNYQKAVEQLKQLKRDRDELQSTMNKEESQDAIRPTGVMVDIIETADTPSRPFMPDPKVAMGAVACGGFVTLASFVMLLVSLRPKRTPRAFPLR